MSENTRYCISRLIASGAVALNLEGADRDAVLAALVERIPELAPRPEARQALLQALLERENLHSTGIGDGLALPHARTALAGLVENAVIVFGRHPTGVPFGGIDNKPVRLFFLLVTTSVTQHLQILARISRLLREARLRDSLISARNRDEVIALIRGAEDRI